MRMERAPRRANAGEMRGEPEVADEGDVDLRGHWRGLMLLG